tara:strand:+ start:738 stop:2000 length:1263 start_codon:yes stop_codon:yes gene_type:complete
MLEKVLRVVVGVSVGAWVARYLGPSDYGALSSVLGIFSIIVAVAALGMDSIVVKKLVQSPAQSGEILGTVFFIKFSVSMAIALVLLLGAMIFGDKWIWIALLSLGVIFQSFNVIDFLFQSKVLSKYIGIANVVALLFVSVTRVILIYIEADIIAFVLVFSVEILIATLGYIYYYFHMAGSIACLTGWKFDAKLAKQLVKESWPLTFSAVLGGLMMKSDVIMLSSMVGETSAGIYAAAGKLTEIFFVVPAVLGRTLFPILTDKAKTDLEHDLHQACYTLFFVASFLIVGGLILSGPAVVHILYGEEYRASVAVLMVHSWCLIFISSRVLSANWFVMKGLQLYSLYRSLSSVAINIGMNFYLIPRYYEIGAAVSLLIALIWATYFFPLLFKDTRQCFKYQTMSFFIWPGVLSFRRLRRRGNK